MDIAVMTCFILRIIAPFIGLIIICLCFFSLRHGRRDNHALIALDDEEKGIRYPVIFWENAVGRSKICDICITDPTVSREHAVLLRRNDGWFITDTGSKAGVYVNDTETDGRYPVYIGDKIRLGATTLTLRRADDPTDGNQRIKIKQRTKTVPNVLILILITFYIFLITLEATINLGNGSAAASAIAFCIVMWAFYAVSKNIFRRKSFELESLALWLSGTGIVLCAVHNQRQSMVQLAAMSLGIILFCFMIWFIEIPDRVMKWRFVISIFAMGLLASTIVLGREQYGAQNWIIIGSFSLQPSEFAKIAYIFVGASTLDQLQTKKNLFGFILVTGICIGMLFFMSDFGTAVVFFVTFLIIAFMRSGDLKTVVLAVTAAVLGVILILSMKPYIADRFQAWGKVWEYADTTGYQQVHTLICAASGGLFGLGLSKGNLQYIFASENDLVFGLASEEMGTFTALLFALVIGCFMLYSRTVTTKSRSAFYSIAACSAGGLLVFQAALNIFGVTDIFPLTGVTLPFVSYGGSSMMACWGLLAFIKAADERTYSNKRIRNKKVPSRVQKNIIVPEDDEEDEEIVFY